MASRQLNSSALPIPLFLSFGSTPVGPKKLRQVASWQAKPKMVFCLTAMKQDTGFLRHYLRLVKRADQLNRMTQESFAGNPDFKTHDRETA
jgi:hypothetical protein